MPELERLIKKINTKFRLKKEFFSNFSLSDNAKIHAAKSIMKYLDKPELKHIVDCLMHTIQSYQHEDDVRIAAKMFSENSNLPGLIGLVQIVNDSINVGKIRKLNRIKQIFENKDLVKKIKLYKEHEYVDKIVYEIGKNARKGVTKGSKYAALNFLKDKIIKDALYRFGEEENICLIRSTYTVFDAKKLIRVFDKYGEYSSIVAKVINENDYGNCHRNDYPEIFSDAAVEEISQSKNPEKTAKKILRGNYSKVKEWMKDLDLSYEDLDIVKKTYGFVLKIHANRSGDDIVKIKDGFFDELKRAMQQGDKSKNLRQYCREVKKLMQENASELMVMYDA